MTWEELKDVILDVEISLNNRPLTYVEDDPEVSVLIGQVSNLTVEDEGSTEQEEMRKRARHISKCKQAMWKRWTANT